MRKGGINGAEREAALFSDGSRFVLEAAEFSIEISAYWLEISIGKTGKYSSKPYRKL